MKRQAAAAAGAALALALAWRLRSPSGIPLGRGSEETVPIPASSAPPPRASPVGGVLERRPFGTLPAEAGPLDLRQPRELMPGAGFAQEGIEWTGALKGDVRVEAETDLGASSFGPDWAPSPDKTLLALHVVVGSEGRGVMETYEPSASTQPRQGRLTLVVERRGGMMRSWRSRDGGPPEGLYEFDLDRWDDTRGRPVSAVRLSVIMNKARRASGHDVYRVSRLRIACADGAACRAGP